MSHNIADRIRDIPSFGPFDLAVLYDFLVSEAPPGSTIAEVGSFHGRSLVYLALKAKESGKGLKIVSVDWGKGMGNGTAPTAEYLRSNVHKFGVQDTVRLITATTDEGAKQFEDGSVYAAFIDDDHSFEGVRTSVSAWLPKVQKGGYLCGHDTLMHTVWETLDDLIPDWIHGPTTNCWIAKR